jgi:hypothetical protein
MLNPQDTFTGYYFYHVDDVSHLNLSRCCLCFEAGTAPNHYIFQYGVVDFHFFNPWDRSGTGESRWGSDWYAIDDVEIALPDDYILGQNYPNPFNTTTGISFELPAAGDVRLDVYNLAGQVVGSLADSYYDAGSHTVVWDASGMASGVYFYRLTAGGKTFTKRMTLLK